MAELKQEFVVQQPRARVWALFQDVATVVECLPGAGLAEPPVGDHVKATMTVKLGPVRASFAGECDIEADEERHVGLIKGTGVDRSQGSRARGSMRYTLEEADGGRATRVLVNVDYALTGALAQFARGGIVEAVAAKLVEDFAGNVEARLAADTQEVGAQDRSMAAETSGLQRGVGSGGELNAFGLLWAIIKNWFAKAFGRERTGARRGDAGSPGGGNGR
ncbi:MAG: hypothetical protein GC150_09240 [Rhizobiales bacterium]|nr:hypothetical protein [Hyphomicrobiales bacterium]